MATEQALRRGLVKTLREQGCLRDGRVAAAFGSVPRHLFVPDQPLKDVYTNRAFVTKLHDGVPVSSSSEPAIMAIMLEQLEVEPGQRVLEIGAGTGYNAALLADLAGASGQVTTVDIDEEIAAAATKHLRQAGMRNVDVIAGDGGYGHPAGAPYDRIIATAGCWQIPQPWIDQLAEDGLLVLPFRLNGAHVSLAFRKQGQELVSTRAAMCGFMPLRGAFGPAHTQLSVDGIRVAADVELGHALRDSLARTLTQERPVRVSFPRTRDARNAPLYYLALQGKPLLNLFRSSTTWGLIPFGLAVSPRSVIALPWLRPQRGKLTLFGSDEALDYLRAALARWQAEGRPDLRQLRVRVRRTARPLGPLPRPGGGGRYRFRRGDHLYELWFER
jgi:methyltransferase of FxLD system